MSCALQWCTRLAVSCPDRGHIEDLLVSGRAMELGRECLQLWGYKRVDELIWVKTNQLQRLIRTGRTGHWLNHSKEHCLVGVKGSPQINRNLDCDVLVAEVHCLMVSSVLHDVHIVIASCWLGHLLHCPADCFQ